MTWDIGGGFGFGGGVAHILTLEPSKNVIMMISMLIYRNGDVGVTRKKEGEIDKPLKKKKQA